MNKFEIGQQVEIIIDPKDSPIYESMLEIMGNPTKVLATIVYIAPNTNILIHSNQLEEHEIGHNGNGHFTDNYKAPSEKGCWWVSAYEIKPYAKQLAINFDIDKLF